jgi:hypothetical protein
MIDVKEPELNALSPQAAQTPHNARRALAQADKLLADLASARLHVDAVIEAVRLGRIRLAPGQMLELDRARKVFSDVQNRIGKDTERLRTWERQVTE